MGIVEILKIPRRCLINQKITKKTLLENAVIKADFKKVVRDDIQELLVVASVSPNTANINSFIDADFCYDEIHLLRVALKKKEALIKSAELLQAAIPYSLVILFQCNDEYCFNIAEKRINQIDNSKRVIGNYTFTEWMSSEDSNFQEFVKSIAFDRISHLHLKAFYEDVTIRIFNLKASSITGDFQIKSREETGVDIQLLRELNQIKEEIYSLRNILNKEIHFNERVNLNVKIKRLEDKMSGLVARFD